MKIRNIIIAITAIGLVSGFKGKVEFINLDNLPEAPNGKYVTYANLSNVEGECTISNQNTAIGAYGCSNHFGQGEITVTKTGSQYEVKGFKNKIKSSEPIKIFDWYYGLDGPYIILDFYGELVEAPAPRNWERHHTEAVLRNGNWISR